MKRNSLWSVTLVIILLLGVCGCEVRERDLTAAPGTLLIYRVTGEGYRTGGELIKAESLPFADSADYIGDVIRASLDPALSPELRSAFPEGAKLLSWEVSDGELNVFLDGSYGEMGDAERSVAAYCLTLTVCGLQNIGSVSIYSGGEPVSLGLKPEDALLYDGGQDPMKKEVWLYFADDEGRYLTAERRLVAVDEQTSLERRVMEELLLGPQSAGLTSAIPDNTALLAIFPDENGLCTVDLSDAFFASGQNAHRERLAVLSIVNSLTSLPGISRVLIRGEGQRTGELLRYLSLSEPIERSEAAIGPANPAKNELDIDIFFALYDGAHLIAAPRIISPEEDGESIESAALGALMSASAESSLVSLFTQDDYFISVETVNGVCTVDLPNSFFTSRGDTPRLRLSIGAIAATLLELDNIGSVMILMEGEGGTFGRLDFREPISINTDIIVE